MLAVLFAVSMAVTPLNSNEVLATVNGVPITRRDLQASLTDTAKKEYDEAVDDLQDVEHSAVRDYVGRQCIATQAQQGKTPTDAIYERELSTDYSHFDANMRNRIESQRERIYTAERATLDELIQKRLLEQAAKAKGMSVEQFNQSLQNDVAPVTKADLDFILAYENSKQKASQEAAPGPQRLEAAIREARLEQKREAAIASMLKSASIQTTLEPPRVDVSAANAPVAGNPNAPVRIIEFTDFECPYCKESEQMLAKLKQQYGDRLAIFYRNYPLPNHLYARPAAIASLCAAEQGKYLAYHDLLFARQNELAHADYGLWAEMAGLDRAKFEQCRQSNAMDARVNADIRDAVAAGVAGTPAFFVNGRLVRDAQALPEVVAEEAAR